MTTPARLLRAYASERRIPTRLLLSLLKNTPADQWRLQIDYDPEQPGRVTGVWIEDSTGTYFRVHTRIEDNYGVVFQISDLEYDLRDCRDCLVVKACDAASPSERLHWERQIDIVDRFMQTRGIQCDLNTPSPL